MGLLRTYVGAMLTATLSPFSSPRSSTSSSRSATTPTSRKAKKPAPAPTEPELEPAAVVTPTHAQTPARVTRSPPGRLADLKVESTLAPALFGEVLLCLDARDGCRLAVKRVELRSARAQLTVGKRVRVVESLQQERAVHRQLVSAGLGAKDNLLLLQEEVQCGGQLYLLFPYCSGGDLFDVVRHSPNSGRLSERTARRYLRDVVRALLALKRQGLAHRDISLENVLLDAQGACQLCDFGLAARHGQLLPPGRVGKAWYMAPEVFAAQDAYDPLAADMWSLGVLLAIMLTGAPMVEKPTMDDRQFRLLQRGGVRKLARAFPQKPSEVAWELLEGLLDLEPQRRLTLEEVRDHRFFSNGLLELL